MTSMISPSDASDIARQWWPSPFGADDELGMLNHVTDAKRLAALSSVRGGRLCAPGCAVAGLPQPSGMRRRGVEPVPRIATRGFLVDVSSHGLGPGGAISVEDVAGIEPEPGDALLFHTGWGANWEDAELYLSGEPG